MTAVTADSGILGVTKPPRGHNRIGVTPRVRVTITPRWNRYQPGVSNTLVPRIRSNLTVITDFEIFNVGRGVIDGPRDPRGH